MFIFILQSRYKLVKRLFACGQVEVNSIRDIKEDINDYIENSQECDFIENEYIYDDIEGLQEMLMEVSQPV